MVDTRMNNGGSGPAVELVINYSARPGGGATSSGNAYFIRDPPPPRGRVRRRNMVRQNDLRIGAQSGRDPASCTGTTESFAASGNSGESVADKTGGRCASSGRLVFFKDVSRKSSLTCRRPEVTNLPDPGVAEATASPAARSCCPGNPPCCAKESRNGTISCRAGTFCTAAAAPAPNEPARRTGSRRPGPPPGRRRAAYRAQAGPNVTRAPAARGRCRLDYLCGSESYTRPAAPPGAWGS
jgi:hypothetical protein